MYINNVNFMTIIYLLCNFSTFFVKCTCIELSLIKNYYYYYCSNRQFRNQNISVPDWVTIQSDLRNRLPVNWADWFPASKTSDVSSTPQLVLYQLQVSAINSLSTIYRYLLYLFYNTTLVSEVIRPRLDVYLSPES